jgi:hypothetical protein
VVVADETHSELRLIQHNSRGVIAFLQPSSGLNRQVPPGIVVSMARAQHAHLVGFAHRAVVNVFVLPVPNDVLRGEPF